MGCAKHFLSEEKKYIFSVDIGTTALKACVYDSDLNLVGQCGRSYELIRNGGFIEFEAERYFSIFLSAFEELSNGLKISAIAIDTQGETIIFADEYGKPLYNAVCWLDVRADKEAESIEKEFSAKKIYQITGQPEVYAGFPAPKILWLKNNLPAIFGKVKKIFLLEDYILFRLTNNFVSQRTLQSSSLYLNINSGEYWQEMLDFLGIDKKMLPSLKESGEYAGSYENIPVFTGALDQISGMLGMGVVNTDIVSEMTGTTLAVCAVSESIPKWHKDLKVPCHYFKKGKYALIMWSGTAGMALKWFKENFDSEKSFIEIDKEAALLPIGSDGLICLPHLTGSTMPINNPNIRGAFYGFDLRHKKAHFARSIMESVACVLNQFMCIIGQNAKEIRSGGGGSKSGLWCEIKAGMTGKRITVLNQQETACLGTAILALKGLGQINEYEDLHSVGHIEKTFIPDNLEEYAKVYKSYIDLENTLQTFAGKNKS